MHKSIREYYEELGSDEFYKLHCNDYNNPHYDTIKKIINEIKPFIGNNVCDLCCGGGEISKCLPDKNILGVDPFTYELYEKNTKNKCLRLTFKDIANGKLTDKKFDTIICSYALHLCEESMLSIVLWQLRQSTDKLIIISPHKRPDCNNISGWMLEYELKENKTTAKIYKKSLV